MTAPRPRPTYDATVRAEASAIRGRWGLGQARALASVHATQARTPLDRAYWSDVLDVLDAPASGPPTTPAPEGQPQ